MRKRLVWLAAAIAVAALIGAFGGSIGAGNGLLQGRRRFLRARPRTWSPELGAVTINQGLGSYANERLARGKETLVRFYLKLKSVVGTQCSGSINVINTSPSAQTRMTIVDPDTTDGDPAGDLPNPIAPYQTYPSAGHPITASSVQVKLERRPDLRLSPPRGSAVACDATSCAFTAPFSLRFKARIYYTTSASSTPALVDFSTMPASTNPITGNFSQLANDLRVLVIPMGDGMPAIQARSSRRRPRRRFRAAWTRSRGCCRCGRV